MKEDPLVRPKKWLKPDLVLPAPFLQCHLCLTPGGSGVMADPARIVEEFRKAWLPRIDVPLRKVHPLTHGTRHVILVHNGLDPYFRFRKGLRDDFGCSASLAVNLGGILNIRLRHHSGTRVCWMTMSDKCATHVFRQRQSKAVWSRRLRVTQVSQCMRRVN